MTERTRTPLWWEMPAFTDGPETEWFVRSVFDKACQAGQTIYWRCTPTRRSVDELDRRLRQAGCRLVLEHDDHPRTRGHRAGQLRRVYVEKDGNGVVIVNRESEAVSLSVASFDPAFMARLTSEKPSTSTTRRPHHRRA